MKNFAFSCQMDGNSLTNNYNYANRQVYCEKNYRQMNVLF